MGVTLPDDVTVYGNCSYIKTATKQLCGSATRDSPRDEALLITRQRQKGLKVVSSPKFSIKSKKSFLGGQSLRVLGEN